MRYSIAFAALSAGAAMAAVQGPVGQIGDGQPQVQVAQSAVASVTEAPASESTVYSTKDIIITSCGPEVESCPAAAHTTAVTTTPSTSSTSTSTTPVAPVETSTTPEAAATTPVSPVETSVAPVAPVAETTACPTCPTCPAAVTVVSTVTVAPAETSSVVAPVETSSTEVPVAPVASNTPVVPGSPASVPAPIGSGVAAPSGTAASTGFVTSAQSTSPPITPFKGAASTIGSSMAVTAIAAFAAIFLA